MEKQMKKNNTIKRKLIKIVGGTLVFGTLMTMTNGCTKETGDQITIQAEEIDYINQHDDEFGILVNKENPISAEQLNKIDLAETKDVNGNVVYLQKDALNAFNELKGALEKDGFEVGINTGFRTFEDQEAVYNELLNEYGKDYADSYSAPVGCSEHHTGLAIDVYFDRNYILGKQIPLQINSKYKRSRNRLYEIMADYGFILRYPEGKEDVTGYPAEAWHIRYVGVELAKFISDKELTLEEYYEIINQYQSTTENENCG